MKCLPAVFLFLLQATKIISSDLVIKYQWEQIDFQFPNPETRANAIKNKHFIQENIIPIDVQTYYGRK